MPIQKFAPRSKRLQNIYTKFTELKDRKKLRSVLLQLIFLVIVISIFVNSLLTFKAYQPYTATSTTVSEDKGFIALSYFGVERAGNQNVISLRRLQDHLRTLKNMGYVTITQQDILEYYQNGKQLPEKSLFLIFEDGRRDTAIFSQKVLEELNFKATVLTYPNKFEKKDVKFLMPEDLKDLEKTTFWELGSNGYRLAFINVFDRYNNYLGELNPLEHAEVAPYLGRKYNHYLMDYIRDEYGIPKESHAKMQARISYDYETLRDVYSQSIGYVPAAYILMHSNTGRFGNNDKVSAVNEYWIKDLFKLNFNREGFSFNQRNSSIYDLTRMQPQAYWYTNHLLMRIKYDINQDVTFVQGNLKKQTAWETVKGALEIQDEIMILTALPKDKGFVRLKNSNDYQDVKLSVRLTGNKLGLQRIYLRADENLARFLEVHILNNVLYVTEKLNGGEKELFKLDLDEHDGKEVISIPEDKKAAEIRALETFRRYAPSVGKTKMYSANLQDKEQEAVPNVADGAQQYVPEISANAQGNRKVELSLAGNKLSITVDNKEAVKDLQVMNTGAGALFLESSWGGYGKSQRNLADDVYDGVFEKLRVTENTGEKDERVLFDSSYHGLEAFLFKTKQLWEAVLGFFVEKL